MSHIVLVPGLWLDASTWDEVVAELEGLGHTTTAVTLPGMGADDTDRGGTTLAEVVGSVTTAIDDADGDAVVVVGHSAGSGIAWAAADARIDRVAHVIAVGGFPIPDGMAVAGDFEAADDGAIALPDWADFDDADVADLDDDARAAFRDAAIPAPACLASEPVVLTDDRRYELPVTVVCPEFTAVQLQSWVDGGAAPVSELARTTNLGLVDLPAGHWPQITRATDLAALIDLTARDDA